MLGDVNHNTGGKPYLLPPPYIKTGTLECLIQTASRIELVEGPEKKKKKNQSKTKEKGQQRKECF